MPKLVVDLNRQTGEVETFTYEDPGPVPPLIKPRIRPRNPDREKTREEREKEKKN